MKKFYTHKVTINKEQNLKRLDQALANLLKDFNRSQIKILAYNKNIFKGEETIKNLSCRVKKGEEYLVKMPVMKQTEYSPENIPLKIIYEDEDIILINKDSGLVTHPAPGNETGTLVQALIKHTNNNLSTVNKERPGIVHRLDKETSGIMVIAKNNFSHLKLADQFKSHSITRRYYALVWGMPKNQKISGYIKRNKMNRKKMALNKNDGKYSETIIKLKQNFGIYSLIDCELKTGRTHQIRLHLTSINSPVIGDKLYGKNKYNKYSKDMKSFNKFLILKKFNRQALHAYHLGFIHPRSNKQVLFESSLPKDIKNLLDFLVKY